VALQASDKIVVAASSITLGTSDFMLMRFDAADGLQDSTFGSPVLGGVLTDFGGASFDTANAIVVQPDGNIVVAGASSAGGSGPNFALARYVGYNPIQVDIGNFFPILEGDDLPLSGERTGDSEGHVIRYEWDFNYDGRSFDVDATGINTRFGAADIDGPASRVIALRVTDDLGLVGMDTALVLIRNAGPTVGIGDPELFVRNQPGQLVLTADDPAPADDAAGFTYIVDWGDGTAPQIVRRTPGNGAGVTVDHVYTRSGEFNVRATATDKDGGTGAASQTVGVKSVALKPSPCDPEKTVLVVGGTLGNDTIRFRRIISTEIQVLINGVFQVRSQFRIS
jgi:hypothetical protein